MSAEYDTHGPIEDRLREANHRISNHLTLVMSMVQVQSRAVATGPASVSRDEVRAMLDETAGKIATVAHLHRWLAQTPHGGEVDLGSYLIQSCTTLIHALGVAGRIALVQKISGHCRVTPEQAQQFGLIVSEIIMNAAKHAHPAGLHTQITLVCRRDVAGRIEVGIDDDGVGLPEGFDDRTGGGVGFKLIRSLVETLKAQLSIESDSLGLSFRVVLPGSRHLSVAAG